MRGMESESIDLIYLDPPFNSKHNYAAPLGSKAAGAAFKDTWTLDDVDVAWWGEIAESNIPLYEVLDMAKHVGGKSTMSYLIYMSIRILEMHRILKDTGTLYLHCDPTMSHYLKMVLDAIFKLSNFRNEIIWKRSAGHPLSIKKFAAVTDNILVYQKTDKCFFQSVRVELDQKYIDKNYKKDEHGRLYISEPLTGGKSGGESAYLSFNGAYPSAGRGWAPPTRKKLPTWITEKLPDDYESLNQVEKCEVLDKIGLIIWSKNNVPRYKHYISDRAVNTVWDDIKLISSHSKERLGYPTQKPLALLERMIKAASKQGYWILDPFCGCATACSAAEKLDRKWIGIDISSKAVDLLKDRLVREAGLDMFTKGAGVLIHRTDVPIRKGRVSKDIKHKLYGLQEGRCNGCGHYFEFRHFHKDHIVPTSTGGPNDDSNLQLLCGHCNILKGTRTMAELKAKLKAKGII